MFRYRVEAAPPFLALIVLTLIDRFTDLSSKTGWIIYYGVFPLAIIGLWILADVLFRRFPPRSRGSKTKLMEARNQARRIIEVLDPYHISGFSDLIFKLRFCLERTEKKSEILNRIAREKIIRSGAKKRKAKQRTERS